MPVVFILPLDFEPISFHLQFPVSPVSVSASAELIQFKLQVEL